MNKYARAIWIDRNNTVIRLVILEMKTVGSIRHHVNLTQGLFLEKLKSLLQFVLLVVFNEFDRQERTLNDLVLFPQLRVVFLDQRNHLVHFALLYKRLYTLSKVYTLLSQTFRYAVLRLWRALLDFRFFNFSSLFVGKRFYYRFVSVLLLHVAVGLNDLLVWVSAKDFEHGVSKSLIHEIVLNKLMVLFVSSNRLSFNLFLLLHGLVLLLAR